MREPDYSILAKLTYRKKLRAHSRNLIGQTFERLTPLGYVGSQRGTLYWLCRCDCGNFTINAGHAMRKHKSKSCGCYVGNRGKAKRTHGMSHTVPHGRWLDMHNRCYNPRFPQARDYSERGIVVCQGLHKFEVFYALMGEPPDNQQLDRINNDGNYSCGSCEECLSKNWPMNLKWSTREEQARNKRNTRWITIADKTQLMVDWLKDSGVPHSTAWQRLARGWTPEQAFGFVKPPTRKRVA